NFGGRYFANVFKIENIFVDDGILNLGFTSIKNNSKISGVVLRRQKSQKDNFSNINFRTEKNFHSYGSSKLEIFLLKLYPNPTQEKVFLDFHTNQKGFWKFFLIGSNGTVFPIGEKYLEVGMHNLKFNLSLQHLSSGVYYFRAVNERGKSK